MNLTHAEKIKQNIDKLILLKKTFKKDVKDNINNELFIINKSLELLIKESIQKNMEN